MTEIDQALVALRADHNDPKAQSGFYDLFLNSMFFIPTIEETIDKEDQSGKEKVEVPLVIVADETDYLVFFDQKDRLFAWAEKDVPFIQLPGHVLAEMTTDELNWAMNIGTDYNKQFAPDEIAWLKDVVERCKLEEESKQ